MEVSPCRFQKNTAKPNQASGWICSTVALIKIKYLGVKVWFYLLRDKYKAPDIFSKRTNCIK